MDELLYLIPAALGLGLIGLIAFLWAMRSGQFEDLDGAAGRILFDGPNEGITGPDDSSSSSNACSDSSSDSGGDCGSSTD